MRPRFVMISSPDLPIPVARPDYFEHTRSEAENTGYVSFIARFSEQGKNGAIIERSRFIKENGQWYYIDGTRPQLGRNDPARAVQAKI